MLLTYLWRTIWDKGRTLNRPMKSIHNNNRAPSVHRQLFHDASHSLTTNGRIKWMMERIFGQ